jgi:hypothetical protein
MPAINKPNQHFDVLTWSGTGGSSGATRSITGLNFQPDFIWEKARSSGTNHQLLDSVRGVGQNKVLASNSTGDEPEAPNTESLYGWLSSLNSSGFTLTNGTSTFDNWNKSADTYVGWNWKAGGTAVTNTSGTISSQVSANPTAGFSIVTYTSTTGTVGHGLGVAPSMIIMKTRNNTDQWTVGHVGLPSWNYGLALNSTGAQDSNSGFWNNTAPTSTVFSQGSWNNTYTKVAYCFASIAGYSSFGSYVGNNSTDGPFVYTGFRPRWVLLKDISTDSPPGSSQWRLWDTSRAPYNVMDNTLQPNGTNTEQTSVGMLIDSLSNGFKLRDTNKAVNQSSDTYIYAAFAEAPFKFSNGR